MASSSTSLDEPTRQKLAKYVVAEIKSGTSPITLSDAIQARYPGVTMGDILPKGSIGIQPTKATDVMRSVLQGVSLGHFDEAAGLISKMMGGDYTTGRDQVRAVDQQFAQQHPGVDIPTRMAGALAPGALVAAVPGAQPEAGAILMNILRGAATGGVLGAVQGEGESTAPTAGGVAQDALKSGAVGGLTGGVMGGATTALYDPLRAPTPGTTAVENATAAIAPRAGDISTVHGGPIDLQSVMQKRMTILPKVVVPADADPGIQQNLLQSIGADPRLAAKARSEAMQRVVTIGKEAADVGKAYDVLSGIPAKIDSGLQQDIQDAATATGRNKQLGLAHVDVNAMKKLPVGASVDLGDLFQIRQVVNANIRKLQSSGANPTLLRQYQTVADKITGYLRGGMPDIDHVDQQFAVLKDWQDAAQSTHDAIHKSIQDFATRSLTKPPATMTVQIPLRWSGVGTAITQTAKQAVGGGPTPPQTAKAIYDLLLTPGTAEQTANRVSVLQMLGAQPIGLGAAGPLTTGSAVAASTLQRPQSP